MSHTHLAPSPSAATLFVALLVCGAFTEVHAQTSAPTWTASGLQTEAIPSLAIDPQTSSTIYAGTSRAGVFKSTDGGGSWSASSAGIYNGFIRALAIDPHTPSTVYAGTDGGVFKSVDGGTSWALLAGLNRGNIEAVVVDSLSPTTLYAGTWGGGIFKSIDGGISWSAVNTGLPVIDGSIEVETLVIDPNVPTTLYTGIHYGGMFKSVDGGTTWFRIVGPLYPLAVDPQFSNIVYAIHGTSGLVKSIDGGETWISANGGVGGLGSALAIDPQTPTTLYAGTLDRGVFKSTDGGNSWSPLSTGLTNTAILSLAIDSLTPTTLYAGTQGGGVFKLEQAGEGPPPPSSTVTRFEETAATYSGWWFPITDDNAGAPLTGGSAQASSEPVSPELRAAAAATFTFTGTAVSWLSLRCEVCGIALVSIDGTVIETVDTFAVTRSTGVVFSRSGLAAGSHTFEIVVTGTRNLSSGAAFIVVDAFDVVN